jgi:hypothetical protein
MTAIAKVLPLLFLLGSGLSAATEQPLACRLDALTASQRDRHRLLGERLRAAAVEVTALADGYELALDLTRLPADKQGAPFCVVEVAEWVDLEARCCPFLDFAVSMSGRGGLVKLRLSGEKGVKDFLREEMGISKSPGSAR